MLEVPVARASARPAAVIVAAEVVADAQVTWPVRSSVVPSERVPVAVNCWVSPLGRLGLAGVTAMDWSTGAVTVSTVESLIPSSVALMFDVPCPTAVATPCEPAALEIVATVPLPRPRSPSRSSPASIRRRRSPWR